MELIPITGAELYYDPHFFQTEQYRSDLILRNK
jgi:hypothetical protein